MCCGAYVMVRYHISGLVIFTDFAKSCSSLGRSLFALAVHRGLVCCCALLCVAQLPGACHLGVLPQAPYAVFARLLPSLAAVWHRAHMVVAVLGPGHRMLFPGV
jgi:hypothetical protein